MIARGITHLNGETTEHLSQLNTSLGDISRKEQV